MELRKALRVRSFVLLAAALQIFTAVFAVSAILLPQTATAVTSIPYLINFQGRLTDNNGNVLSDGNYNIKFRIFNAASSGTNEWEGDRVFGASDHRVSVKNGLFNIQFGDTSQGDPALSPSLFNATGALANLYVEVELPTPATATCASNGCASFTEGAMTPRQPLASSPYAFNADQLDGLDSSAFGQLSAANSFSGANTFSNTNTFSASSGAGIVLSGTPATGGSVLQIGSALSSGNSSGTLIGANGSFSGDLLNLQVSNSTKLKVDNSGNLTLASGAAITIGSSAGQGVSCSGGQVLQNQVTVGGIVTSGSCAAITATAADTALDNLASVNINAALNFNATQAANIGFITAASAAGNTLTVTGQAAGSGGTGNNAGGNLAVSAGTAAGTAAGGTLTLTGGNAQTTGTDGTLTLDAGSGATTANGTITIGTANATTISLGNATVASTVNLANGSGANTINLGNTQTGGSLSLGAAMTTGTITLGGAVAQTGTIILGQSTGTNLVRLGDGTGATTIQIGTGVTNAKTISIGTGAAMANTISIGGTGANVITMGNTQTAGSVTIGNAMTTGTIQIGSTGAQTGTITFGGGTGAQTVNLGTGNAVKTVHIADGTGANVITLGTGQTAGSVSIGTAMTTGTITLGGAVAQTGTIIVGQSTGTNTVRVGDGTGATTIQIGTGVTNAKTISIGTGAAMANTINIGGTGANAITVGNTQTTGSISIGGALTTGTLTLGSLAATGAGTTVLQGGNATTGVGAVSIQAATNGLITLGTTNGNPITTGAGAVTLGGSTTISSGKNLTVTSGSFTQTFTSAAAANGQTLAFSNTNSAGAGVTVQGINITPTESTPTSGTNNLNLINFAAGSGNVATALTNGINFASATGYTNYISSPSFNVNSSGDNTTAFTSLGVSNTTNGTGSSSTSLVLNSATGFVAGDYVQVNSANCGGTGVNPCYAKISSIASNTLTITPALTWANGSTVNLYHIPEIGGTDTAKTLSNRYGLGYFIAGVAAGNGTTYYQENTVDTSLASFSLLNDSNLTNLTIGNAATATTIGGNLTVSGSITVPSSGSDGYLTRSGSSLSPTNSGDSFTTTGNISTTGSGTITSAGVLSGVGVNSGSGAIQGTGGLAITGNSTIAGTLGSITSLTLSGAISGGTTYSGSGDINTTGGVLQTNSTTRIDNSGNLSNIGTISATAAATSGTATTLAFTNSGSSGANTTNAATINLTGTDNASGSNTTTGLNFGNVTAHTNNTYTGVNFGTGLSNDLTYNGSTIIINGTGQLNGAQLQSASVANAALANSSISTSLTGLTGSSSVALGGTLTLGVAYGSGSNTAVQGNTQITCPTTSGNLSGSGNTITLGSGGNCGAIAMTNAPTFSGQLTLSGNGAASTPILNFTGTPAANATTSLVQLAGPIASGNANTNGGTYLGINLPSSGAGSAADFANLQKANTVEFKVDNSGNLTAGGTITVGSFASATSTPVCSNAGILATCNALPSSTSLQQAYGNGNTISTSGNDIGFTLNSGNNFTVATAASGTGFTTFSLTDGSNATPPAQLVLVKNNDVNQPLATGISVQSAAGTITTALDASGSNITNALAIGANAISGTHFSVTGAGAVTAVGLNAGTGNISGTGGLAITGNSTIAGTLGSITSLTLSGAISGGTTYSGSGNINTTGGTIQTNSTDRITNAGNLTNIGTISAANSATSGTNTTLATTNSGSSGSNTVKGVGITIAGTDNASGSNATTGLDFGNVTAHTNNTYTGINFGTGLTNQLTYNNGTSTVAIINGSGQVNGAQLQSGTVANGALTNSSLTVGTTGNLTGGGSVSLGGTLTLNITNNPTFSTSVTTPIIDNAGSLSVGASATTFTLGKSGVTAAFAGPVSVGSFASATSTPVCSNAGTLATCNANPSGVTLQQAYTAGNTISTSGNDIGFTLNSGQNFTVATAASATGFTTFSLTDGSNATPPAQLVLVKNNDVNQPLATGISVQSAAGGITTAFDASGTGITNALAIGGNAISGTHFSVTAAGAVTAVGVNTGTGALQTGGTNRLDNSGNLSNIGTISAAPSLNTGTAATLAVTNSGASGTNTVTDEAINLTGTSTSGTNNTTGLNFGNVSNPGGTNNYYAINLGTGFTNLLTYNGTSGTVIINGSGQLAGADLAPNSVANGALTNSSLTVGTTGNLTGGGSVSLGGTLTLNTVNNPSFSTSVTTPIIDNAGSLSIGASATTFTLGKSGVTASFSGPISSGSNSITSTGTIGAGTIQTGSTNRIDSSGNLSNIGTISATTTAASGTSTTLATTNSGASGTNSVTGIGVNLTGTNTSGTNNTTGLNFGNVTNPGGTNNYYGINFGTGFTSLLTYNGSGTVIINGTGQLNGAQLSSGSVANGALTNSSLTVSPGTGLTGGGSVSLGGTTTLNVDQTASLSWTGAEQFNKSGGVGVQFNGTAASGGAQLLFGSVTSLNGGSANGTYLGANPASYTGDFINFAINGANRLKVDNSGNLTTGGTVNGATLSATTVDGVTLSNVALLNASQAFTNTNTFQPTTNVSSVIVKQNSSGSFGQDVFDVQGSSSGNFIQVSSTAANQGAVTVQSLGSQALTLQSGNGQVTLGSSTSLTASGALTLESTGSNALTLATQTSGQNVILAPNGTGVVQVNGTTPTVSGNTTLTLQSASGNNINITPGTTGVVVVGGNTPTVTTSGATALKVDTGGGAQLSLGTTNANNVTIGNTTSTTTTNLVGGTAANAINFAPATNGGIFGATTGTGVIEFDSGAGIVEQSTTNNTQAFQIQNSGGISMLNIDTLTGATTNLLTNSGFEHNPITGWVALAAGGSIAHDTTQAFSDFASGKTSTSTTAGGGFDEPVTLSTSTQYTFSFYAKADATTPSITDLRAGYSSTGAAGGEVNCTLNSTTIITSGWMRYTCTFTTPGTSSGAPYIYIGHTTTTNDTFYVDAAQLELGSFASPYGQGQLTLNATINSPVNFQETANSINAFQVTNTIGTNILNVDTFNNNQNNQATNPSFEAGLTGWVARAGCTLTQDNTTGYNGTSSSLCTDTATASAGMNMTGISPVMVSGTTYTLALYAKSSTDMTTLEIGHSDTGLAANDTACLTAQTVTSLGWKRFTCTWTAGAQSGTPYIYVKQTDATAHTFWVDAVTLETDANASSNYRDGRISLGSATISSPAIFQTLTNSTTAFQVQNAAGIQVFDIDTASDTNLVSNSGFEVNSIGWSLMNGASAPIRDTTKSYVGIASGKTTTTVTANSGMRFTFSSALPAVAATSYTISAYVESSAADATFNLGYNNGADTDCASITPTASATVPATTGWTRFVCSTPVNTTVNSIFITSGTGNAVTLDVDAVQVVLGSTASAFGNSNISFNGVFTSPIAIRNPNNTTTEFQVQDAQSNTLFGIDSLNDTISVGATGAQAIASTVNLGTSTGATQTVNVGATGNGTAAAGTLVNIQGGTTADTAIKLGTNGAGGITVDTGTNGAGGTVGNINIGTGTTGNPTKTINIGATATSTGTQNINLGVNVAGTQTIKVGSSSNGGAAAGTTVNIQGGTTANTAVLIGTNGAGGITIDSGTTGGINIGNNSNAKTIQIGNSLAGTALSLDAGSTGLLQIGNTTAAHTIDIGNGGAAAGNAETINIGSPSTTTASKIILTGGNNNTTGGDGVVIGSATTDTNQVNLQLDGSSTFAETASTCTTTVNQGAMYYNTSSNAIRSCVNGGWEDVVTTAGLGIMLFGVVPDSGVSADQGDLAALGTTGKSGPCKVSAATASTVNIEGCVLYSGGRKRIVAANAAFTVPLSGTNIWVHICMNNSAGNENVPLATAATTETGSLPAFSINNPVVCLADVKVNAAAIQAVYDVRPFTTSQKDFVTVNTAAVGLGWIVIPSGSNVVSPGVVTLAQSVRGVVVASNGGTSTTTPNGIISVSGPTMVKSTAGTAGAIVTQGTTTNGYAVTGGSAAATYSQMGYARKTFPTTACTTTLNATDCDQSLYFFMSLR